MAHGIGTDGNGRWGEAGIDCIIDLDAIILRLILPQDSYIPPTPYHSVYDTMAIAGPLLSSHPGITVVFSLSCAVNLGESQHGLTRLCGWI